MEPPTVLLQGKLGVSQILLNPVFIFITIKKKKELTLLWVDVLILGSLY